MLAVNDLEENRPSGESGAALLLGTSTSARLLGISKTEIYRLITRRELRSIVIGRRRLIARVELERYVAAKYAETGE